MFSRRKAVIATVTVILLLLVSVGLFISLNLWYQETLSREEAQLDKEDFERTIQVQKIDGTKLYLENQFKDDLNITQIMVGGKVCELPNATIDKGLSIIDIGFCTYGFDSQVTDVALVTDFGVKNEFQFIRGVFNTTFIVDFQTGPCDISSGYVRLYGIEALDNTHAERASSSTYTYNICARHADYTLGTSTVGISQTLFYLTEDLNSHIWINQSSIYEAPSSWVPVAISSSGGSFDLRIQPTRPNETYVCVGKVDIDDVYGSHIGDCGTSSHPDTLWLSLI